MASNQHQGLSPVETNGFMGKGGKGDRKGKVDKSQLVCHKCHCGKGKGTGDSKGKGKGQGSGNLSGKGDGDKSKNQVICNPCGKSGHKKSECKSNHHKDGHY